MPLKPVKRIYNCTDADLIKKSGQIAACITRDHSSFSGFAVSDSTVSTFSGYKQLFQDKISDDEMIADQTTATAAKNTSRKNLENILRYVKGIAETVYKGEGKYRKFGFEDFTSMRDNDFIRAVRRISRVCNDLSAEIQVTVGGIVDAIDNLGNEGDAFDTALDAIVAARNARDIATQDRVVAGNILYAELVRLCDIGKTIFQDSDEAKYNDYVLNLQSAPAAPKLTGTITDFNTHAPIAGVTVADIANTYTATSAADGTYSLIMPADTYSILFRKNGYLDGQESEVELTSYHTTTLDFQMTPGT